LKYQSVKAFEIYLQKAKPEELPPVFLLIGSCSYTSRKVVDKIVAKLEGVSFSAKDLAETSMKNALEDVNTFSLFLQKKALYLQGIEKCKKTEFSLLSSYVNSPSDHSYLLIGSSSAKGLSEILAKSGKNLVVFDLSTEKPWELKTRLTHAIVGKIAKEKKSVSPQVIDVLFERIGMILPALEREAEKLIAYVGERPNITVQDVQMLCAKQKTLSLFELIDQILWAEMRVLSSEEIDMSLLFPLFSQMRNQLQIGLTIATCKQRGANQQEVAAYLPKLRPTALERWLKPNRKRSIRFFQAALSLLFKIELMAKNSNTDPEALFDLLVSKLHQLRRIDAHAIPKYT